jgi:hypothetical protein
MTCAPLFRCLPSDPRATIRLARKRTADDFPSVRTFDSFMFHLPNSACWDDCKMMVSISNRVIRETLQRRMWLE